MFTFNGVDYKSKSVVAELLIKEHKLTRTEISNLLGVTYQTVQGVMKKLGLKSSQMVKKQKKVKPVKQAIENTEAPIAQ